VKLTPWMLTVASFLIIALLAVGFLFKRLMAREEVVAAKDEPRLLPMAVSDIEPGTLITRAHVGNGPWGDKEKKLEPDTLLSLDGVVGRIAKERISAAQPLRGSQFYAPGDHPDLKVGENMRAVTIDVGEDTAMVNGLIKPGQFVDVHMTTARPVTTSRQQRNFSIEDSMTLTLFEGVRVIAINRSYSTTTVDRGHNVTLELDEEQARIALLANQKGSLALTFNPDGSGSGGIHVDSEEDRVTLYEVLGITPEPEKQKPFMTEHYRNGRHGNMYFEDGHRVQYSGSGAGGDYDSGSRMDNIGGSGDDWTTSKDTPEKSQDVSQQKPAGTTL
jgi:pilus assembly protein CpaB